MPAKIATQPPAQKSFVAALETLGCKIEKIVDDSGIFFMYGGLYYVASPSEDQTYVNVIFPKFTDVSGFASFPAANEAIHCLNARMKLARVWIDDGQLHASSETILDPCMQLDSVLSRLLRTLQAITLETRICQRLSHVQEGRIEPDDSADQTSQRSVSFH